MSGYAVLYLASLIAGIAAVALSAYNLGHRRGLVEGISVARPEREKP